MLQGDQVEEAAPGRHDGRRAAPIAESNRWWNPSGGRPPRPRRPIGPGRPRPSRRLPTPSPPPRTEPARHASSRPAGHARHTAATGGPDPGWASTFAPPAGPDVSPSRPPLPSTPRIDPFGLPGRGPADRRGIRPPERAGPGRDGGGLQGQAREAQAARRLEDGLHATRTNDPQELARFQAEAEAVARLHHPNIVQIYEVGEQDGSPVPRPRVRDGGDA